MPPLSEPSAARRLPPPPARDRFLAAYRRGGWRGFSRLYGLLKSRRGEARLRVICRYGTQFDLDPWDYVDGHVIAHGFYESEVLEAVRPALGAGAVLWVVGANFGLHAVTAKRLHPDARVVAFEPFPAMAARLAAHAALNGVEIELQAFALSDSDGVRPFFINASGNPAMSTLHPDPAGRYDGRLSVTTRTGTAVIAEGAAPAPTAAIIDAEGAEAEILRGLGSHLRAPALRSIVFEAPNEFLRSRHPAAVFAPLADAGFAIDRLDRREPTAHTLSNFLAHR